MIVVIAILSAMMMISSSQAVSSAKASNVVTNLNAIKAAALSYYTDHMDTIKQQGMGKVSGNVTKTAGRVKIEQKDLLPYLKKTNEESETDAAASLNGYSLVVDGWDVWYAKCDLAEITGGNKTEWKSILQKLGDRTRSSGIVFGDSEDASNNKYLSYDGKTLYKYVFMWVR